MREYWSYIDEGDQFYTLAKRAFEKKNVFSNQVLYNLLTMSIEKYFTGLMVSHDKVPNYYTFNELLQSVREFTDMDYTIIDELNSLESIAESSYVKNDHLSAIEEGSLSKIIGVAEKIKDLVVMDSIH